MDNIMKTKEEIFNTDEEAFKAMDEYVEQEAIAFAKFIHTNATSMLMNDNGISWKLMV